MTTLVLGWDGLDPGRVERFGLGSAFGPSRTSVETITNSDLGKPHTYEVWPSIITGRRPDEHGIRAEEYIEGGWASWWLQAAARASRVLPESARWRAGRLVRDHGAEYDFETADYYETRDVRTLFDGRGAVPLGIPNYRSQVDDQLGLTMDRGAALGDYLDVTTTDDGGTQHRPAVALSKLSLRLAGEAGEKLAAAEAALAASPDLVFVWLGYLDTVGHVAPTVEDPDGWQRDHYQRAARWTTQLRNQVDGEVVVVSDHGLEAGRHTDQAFLGADGLDVQHCDHVLDVNDLVDDAAGSSGREWQSGFAVGEAAASERVEGQLESLGYL